MKNKILLISLALVFALSLGLVGCTTPTTGPTPSLEIVIAAACSKTLGLSQIHDLAKKPIVETYVADNPTITVGTTSYPVELDLRDDASSLANMLDITDNIIDDIHTGTVHFLLGPTCTAFLERQAPLCTTGEVVQMGMEGGATSLLNELENYEYSFFNLSFSNWFQIPVLAKMIAESANWTAADHAYIGYESDDHGLEYKGQAEKYFAKEGITIDGSFAMPAGDGGASTVTVIANAQAAGSAILCVFAYPEHIFGVSAISQGMGYDPKAVILGPGANFGFYSDIAGAATEGVMCFATGNNKTETGNTADTIKHMEDTVGFGNTDYWGNPCYWTAMDFIYTGAAEKGVSVTEGFTIDQTAFRSYLAETELDSAFGNTSYVTPSVALNSTTYSWTDAQLVNPVPDGYGALLSYKCHTGEIGQWQSGYIEIVGYADIGSPTLDEYTLTNYDVTASFIYPKASWLP